MVQLWRSFEVVVPLFAVAVVAAGLATALVALVRRRKARRAGDAATGSVTLVLDALLVLWLLGLGLVTFVGGRPGGPSDVELVPLRGIIDLLTHSVWWQVPFVQIGGKIALFVPGGALAVARWRWGVGRATLAGVGIALVVETLQGATSRGVASVDDVLLAGLGTAVGAAIWSLVARAVARRRAGRTPMTATA